MDERTAELLVERLIRRVEQANTYFLTKIGSSIKRIKKLTPTQAQQLIQMLRYGGSYEEIIKQIAKYTGLNIADIEDIFSAYAKEDMMFYERFYKYRGIPFEETETLALQRRALTEIAKNEMYNFTRSNVIGYTIDGKFYNMRETYNKVLDEAFLNVGQGKETFDEAMRKILKQIGGSGLKTIEYESGRSIRLDSAIKMHLKGRLRELHNENQKIIGEIIGADGVEISVHENPAVDHQHAQGHQLYNDQFQLLQTTGKAKDVNGNVIDLHVKTKKGKEYQTFRPISEMNCYHYIFSIIVGVSNPNYSENELQQIVDRNNKGFEFDGKHYTMYQGTQLQRNLEREIRRQKDMQILAKASGDVDTISKTQLKITQLTRKYQKLSDVSGLPTKMKRMSVSGYRRIKVPSITKPVVNNATKPVVDSVEWLVDDPNYEFKEVFGVLSRSLEDKNIEVDNRVYNVHNKLIVKNMEQLDRLSEKYSHDAFFDKPLKLTTMASKGRTYGDASYRNHEIRLSNKHYSDPQMFKQAQLRDIESGWHYKVPDSNVDIYTLTHEYGHIVEYNFLEKVRLNRLKTNVSFNYKTVDSELRDTIIANATKKIDSKITKTEFKNKYFSRYAMSKKNYEWFAELFAKMELGEKDEFTEALREWLVKFYE